MTTEPEERSLDEVPPEAWEAVQKRLDEAVVYPCPACPKRPKTDGARKAHFTRMHWNMPRPTVWPDPVPAHTDPPEAPREDPMAQPTVTPVPAGAELPGGKGTVLSRGALIEPAAEEEASSARPFEPVASAPDEPPANGSVPAALRAQALRDIAGEPPWMPLWARADAILKAQSACAEALIPLTTRDRGIVLAWLQVVLESDDGEIRDA